jgi:outer membrane protein assembly factor BamA
MTRRPATSVALAVILGMGLGLAEPSAHAKDAEPPIVVGPGPGDDKAPVPSPDQARSYDEDLPVDPADVALFVPRAVLFVPRWTLWALWYPFNATLALLAEHKVLEHIEDFLYNDERTAGIVPSLSASTIFGPTIGAKAFHDDLAGHGEHGHISAKFGGRFEQAYEVAFKADRTGGTRLWLDSSARFERENAIVFYGLGDVPTSTEPGDPRALDTEAHYRHQRLLLKNRVGYTFGGDAERYKLGATARYSAHEYGPAPDDDASIETIYDTSRLVGFDLGYELLELDANFIVDTRDVKGATSRGLFFQAFGGGVPPIRGGYQFAHWGAEAVGYIPLLESFRVNETRVLVLRAFFESVDGPDEGIPFNELPRLGGARRLRGYPIDRYRDEKAYGATLEYHYPIHQFIAGSLFLDAGRVFRKYEDIGDSAPHFGGGLGFLVRSKDSQLFALDVAYGDGVQVHFTSDPLRAFDAEDQEL